MATQILERRLLTAKEVAVLLGCRPKRVRELVYEGRLRSLRFSDTGTHRFRPEDVELLIAGEDAP